VLGFNERRTLRRIFDAPQQQRRSARRHESGAKSDITRTTLHNLMMLKALACRPDAAGAREDGDVRAAAQLLRRTRSRELTRSCAIDLIPLMVA
jgi:hypothetical protein